VPNPQGNPFILLAVVLCSWGVVRTMQHQRAPLDRQDAAIRATTNPSLGAVIAIETRKNDSSSGRFDHPESTVIDSHYKKPLPHDTGPKSPFMVLKTWSMKRPLAQGPPALILVNSALRIGAIALEDGYPILQQSNQSLSNPLAPELSKSAVYANKLSIYAYSFWRSGQNDSKSSFGGQYGASQTALIATYPLSGRLQGVSILGRLTLVPSTTSQSELALGARWQPSRSIPITLSAERRTQTDGQGRFSLYLTGSKDNVALPAGFNLTGYGQLGLVSRRLDSGSRDVFYDAQVKLKRPFVSGPGLKTTIGVGAWAGGQHDVSRFDIGPTVHAVLRLNKGQLHIDAEWRFRVKGSARPDSGPALTLSTSF
jgi:hypothetical protein